MKTRKVVELIWSIFLPRLGEILFAAVFAAIIGLGPQLMNVDGDLGRHITLGSYILESRVIPTRDIFSFTKTGDPLTPHEWMADVVFALAHKIAGLDGVVWVTGLVLAASLWLVYKHSLNLSNTSLISLGGGILWAAASSVHWLTRPHIFTIFYTALWTIELDRIRLGVRKSWLVFPVIMLFWVNFHGAFIAGFMIWAAYTLGCILEKGQSRKKIRTLLLIGPITFLVTLLNPDGFGVWRTGFGFLGNQYLVSHTVEYLPPDFQNPAFWPFLAALLLSLLIIGLSKNRLNYPYLFLLVGWTAMALYSARNIPLYLVVVIPIICDAASKLISADPENKIKRWMTEFQGKIDNTERQIRGGFLATATVIAAILLLATGHQLDFQKSGNEFSHEVFPVEAVNWIEKNPLEGNGFNYFPWGGYLLYRMWPGNQVFIDGQTDFYGEELTREYEQVISMQDGFIDVFDKYKIKWVLIPAKSALSAYLTGSSDWQVLYQDQTACLFYLVPDS